MEIRRGVVVDAGCDLSTLDLKRLGIAVWPIEVVRGGSKTLDLRDDAATAEFYAHFEPGAAQTHPAPPAIAREQLMALAETLALMGSHFYSPQQISYLVAANGLDATIAHDQEVTAWVIVDKP